MRLRLSIVLSALWATTAPAQERLAPEKPGVLDDYRANVRAVLKEAFGPDVKLRAIVEPSFQPEFAVGLRQQGTAYVIFTVQPKQQVWTYNVIELMKRGQIRHLGPDGESHTDDQIKQLEAGLPRDPRGLPLTRCSIKVNEALAASLTAVWSEMLHEVRPGETLPLGLDGTTYHFSMPTEAGPLAGQTWSPDDDTRPGKLVRAVYEMRNFCQTRRAKQLKALTALVEELGDSKPVAESQ